MTFDEAFEFVKFEFEADDGLLIQFRMSEDIGIKKIELFLGAIEAIQMHYKGEKIIDRYLVNILNTLQNTLKASASHWVNRDEEFWPDGIDRNNLFAIYTGIDRVYSE